MRRAALIAWLAVLAAPGVEAAEVVWLQPPADEVRARVAEAAGATRPALGPLDLRSAATEWSSADDEALRALDAVLAQVRDYETKLDGELLIMRDLAGPIEGVTALRDEADRDRLYRALAYQGFAVDRFFGDALATDPQADPYRVELTAGVVEAPWSDAVALHPEHEVTPYDIAEVPQRVAYGEVRSKVLAALPATVVPVDLPERARLVVDGVERALGPAGNIKLPPGRHLVTAVVDGRIVGRWDLQIASGDVAEAAVALTDVVWGDWIAALRVGSEVPAALVPCIQALGGEVWLARPTDRGPEVLRVTPSGVSEIELPRTASASPRPSLSGAVGAGAGWFSTADFYLQDPASVEPTFAAVNAGAAVFYAAVDADMGIFRAGVGVDLAGTLGAHHVALHGNDGSTRLRPFVHAAAGVRWAQLTLGYQFPYHRAVGARAQVVVAGPLELRGSAVVGLPSTRQREDGSIWVAAPTFWATGGLGVRI